MENTIGKFEMELLLAVWNLGNRAYGISIADRLRDRTGASPTIGKLYSTLDRLDRKGFLDHRMGEPTQERGGRRKKYFKISGAGQAVAAAAFARVTALAEGLPLPIGAGQAVAAAAFTRFAALAEWLPLPTGGEVTA